MGWFWATGTLENVSPDGGGICGGVIVSADLETECLKSNLLEVSVVFGVELLSEATKSVSLDIDGYGLRDLESTSRPECGLDMGNGLQVYGDGVLLSDNTNVLRFSGTSIGASNTLNTTQDIIVVSPAYLGSLDGGSASSTTDDPVDGGDAYNNNLPINGGDA